MYVSRAGLKLRAALDAFGVDLDGAAILDVGASTGGVAEAAAAANGGRRRGEGEGEFVLQTRSVLERGATWDVACARVTDRLAVPQVGLLAGLPRLSLYFYDGAECLRSLDENAKAVSRPRGYSCEELGGLAWGWDAEFPKMQRLSLDLSLIHI